jgi:drug/metabolite transporter (DMT)-like permease
MKIKGIGILIISALVWGIGNTITGITASKYADNSSVLASFEIAIANISGGLSLLFLLKLLSWGFAKNKVPGTPLMRKETSEWKTILLAGVVKGANTFLFILSTVFIASTNSLVLESTYIVWTLLYVVIVYNSRLNLKLIVPFSFGLFAGIMLLSLNPDTIYNINLPGGGVAIAAGICYAVYLLSWSRISHNMIGFVKSVGYTIKLLSVSFFTVFVLAELFSLLGTKSLLIPTTNISVTDFLVQYINGLFVIGVVYLLITIGMNILQNEHKHTGYISAVCLSMSIVFAACSESLFKSAIPSPAYLIGIVVFMISFIVLSKHFNSEKKRGNVNV